MDYNKIVSDLSSLKTDIKWIKESINELKDSVNGVFDNYKEQKEQYDNNLKKTKRYWITTLVSITTAIISLLTVGIAYQSVKKSDNIVRSKEDKYVLVPCSNGDCPPIGEVVDGSKLQKKGYNK